MKFYIDADILIWQLRGKREAAEALLRIRKQREAELWTGAMQRAEIVFFMRPDEHERTFELLNRIGTAPVQRETVDLAGDIFRRWNPSHGVGRNDAILAATAILNRGTVVTQNVKRFPMPELAVRKGWDDGAAGD